MAADPQNKCDAKRKTLERRLAKGPPAVGAGAWRKRNEALIKDIGYWCAQAQQQDTSLLNQLAAQTAPEPLVLPPLPPTPQPRSSGNVTKAVVGTAAVVILMGVGGTLLARSMR